MLQGCSDTEGLPVSYIYAESVKNLTEFEALLLYKCNSIEIEIEVT
jgi:hypothetical protein